MKTIDILGIYESLTTLADKDLDLNTACDIAKNIQNLTIPKQIIEQRRTKLIQDYSEKDKDGNIKTNENGTVIFTGTNEIECNKRLTDLFNEDVDVELIKIKKSTLKDIKISPKVALGLIDILKE